MADPNPIVSHINVQVKGNDLPPAVRGQLLEISVDQNVHLPAMFTIRLYDPGMTLLDGNLFELTQPVEISSETAEGKKVKLIEGEITALEPIFGKGMIAELTIRGYDKSHRLYRKRNSKTWLNVKDSDIAQEIAQKTDLSAQVEPTPTVYEHLYQDNQSDLEFLRQRANRIGYECFVVDKELHFRKPVSDKPTNSIAWGSELIAFHPRVALAEQVNEVWVKGWDVQRKSAILGRAESGQLYPKIKDTQDGKAWGEKFGESRMVVVDQPVISQAEADIVAAARLDEISGTFIEATGEAFRRPDIQAGQPLQIDGLGQRLSGNYLVTQSNHVYTDAGLKTYFKVTGARTGLLSEQLGHISGPQEWGGLAPAIVTNTKDPNKWGRVKVKYPWMSDEEESGWARLLGLGAGPECGLTFIPEVNDEVMVAFHHGDFNSPVVLGGMWNGQDALPKAVADASDGEKPLIRTWTSRTGHRITMYDDAKNKVEVETAGSHRFLLDDTEKKIMLTSAGGLELILDDNSSAVTINSGGPVEITASSDLSLNGTNIKIKASGMLNIEAGGTATVKGASVSVDSSGPATIAGKPIKLN